MMKIPYIINQYVEGLLQLVYPPVCLICNHAIHDSWSNKTVCQNCFQSIKPVNPEFVQEQLVNRFDRCWMSGVTVAVQFDSVFQEIMHHIKYNQMGKLALAISQYCWRFLQDELTLEGNKLVIPVPLHPVREKERGFNQSYVIAKGLFDNHNLPIKTDLLLRKKNTPSQTTLNRQERIENVYQAFEIRQGEYIKDQKIILVDDVATTGATLNECARLLMIAGASKITGVALATPVDENHKMDPTFSSSGKA